MVVLGSQEQRPPSTQLVGHSRGLGVADREGGGDGVEGDPMHRMASRDPFEGDGEEEGACPNEGVGGCTRKSPAGEAGHRLHQIFCQTGGHADSQMTASFHHPLGVLPCPHHKWEGEGVGRDRGYPLHKTLVQSCLLHHWSHHQPLQ